MNSSPLPKKSLRSQYDELTRNERLIRENEEKFRSLVEYGLEAILILDLQGKILFANNAALNLAEAGSDTGFIGRNVMEFIAPGHGWIVSGILFRYLMVTMHILYIST